MEQKSAEATGFWQISLFDKEMLMVMTMNGAISANSNV
jgi:hypothetical protein